MIKILSFDVSSVSTGWSFLEDGSLKKFGVIEPHKDYCLQEKLYWFKNNVNALLRIFEPDYIIVEETYLKNVITLKTLMQFITIINLECFMVLNKKVISVSPQTVRSRYKLKDKSMVFEYVKNRYKVKLRKYTFKDGNDITDAIILGLYWYDKLMESEEDND